MTEATRFRPTSELPSLELAQRIQTFIEAAQEAMDEAAEKFFDLILQNKNQPHVLNYDRALEKSRTLSDCLVNLNNATSLVQLFRAVRLLQEWADAFVIVVSVGAVREEMKNGKARKQLETERVAANALRQHIQKIQQNLDQLRSELRP